MNKIIMTLLCVFIAATVTGQSIDTLIQMAKSHNPGLRALNLEYKAALKIVEQKGDYPDPKVNLGLGVLPVETRLGAQRMKLGITQAIPWKGLLEARQDLAAAQADIKASMGSIKTIDIAYAIRIAYSTVIFLEDRITLIDQRLEVLDILEELAKSALRSGKGKLSNVLFIERNREMLEEEKVILEKQKEQPTIMINRWTGRPLDTVINLIDSTYISPDFISGGIDQYVDFSENNHPSLKVLESKITASARSIELTRLEEKPKIGVGLDYALVDDRNDVTIANNGRDILMPMASISIPLNKGRFEAKRQEEIIKQDAIKATADDMREMYKAEIFSAQSNIELAELSIQKENKLKVITRETLKLMRTEYASEGTRFEELLRLEMELIDFEMEIINANYQKSLAQSILFKYQ
ncbi:MAG: TolC family protein [Bacteroidia bacterium]|nr:TolC family protein [Bacteroidia bacterium]